MDLAQVKLTLARTFLVSKMVVLWLQARTLTNLGVVVKQQVISALVAGAVVGASATVPLHHHRLVGCAGAALTPYFHHCAHVAFTVVLVAPLPVNAAHHAHAHLHGAADRWASTAATGLAAALPGGSRRRLGRGMGGGGAAGAAGTRASWWQREGAE